MRSGEAQVADYLAAGLDADGNTPADALGNEELSELSEEFWGDGHDHGGSNPWEWAGVFEMPADAASTWTFEKVKGAYADKTMDICWISADTNDAAGLEAAEAHAKERESRRKAQEAVHAASASSGATPPSKKAKAKKGKKKKLVAIEEEPPAGGGGRGCIYTPTRMHYKHGLCTCTCTRGRNARIKLACL